MEWNVFDLSWHGDECTCLCKIKSSHEKTSFLLRYVQWLSSMYDVNEIKDTWLSHCSSPHAEVNTFSIVICSHVTTYATTSILHVNSSNKASKLSFLFQQTWMSNFHFARCKYVNDYRRIFAHKNWFWWRMWFIVQSYK